MTRTRLVLVLFMIFGLQACAAFTGVTPTNLEPVLVGAQRANVEAVLGGPSETNPNGCGSIDTYDYNQGRRPEPAVVALGMVHPAAPLVVGLIAHPFLYYGQKADLDVIYDPHDTVIKYGPRDPGDWDNLFSNNHLWVDQTTTDDVARHYHRIGTADAVDPGTARSCLCHAARLGHIDSQIQLAGTVQQAPAPAAGHLPAMALAGFETAASNAPQQPIPEMTAMETGLIPEISDASQPPPVPAHVIVEACGAPPIEREAPRS